MKQNSPLDSIKTTGIVLFSPMSIWALTQVIEMGQTRSKKNWPWQADGECFHQYIAPIMFPTNPVLRDLFMLLVLLFLYYRMELSMMEAGKSSVRSSQGWGLSKLDSVVRNFAGKHSPLLWVFFSVLPLHTSLAGH